MTEITIPFLTGIIERLESVSGVTDIVGQRIYTDVPDTPTFPFIMVEVSNRPYDGKDFTGQEYRLIVHGFTRKEADPHQCLSIRSAVYNALNRQEDNVSISGGNLIYLAQDGLSDIFREEDGATWHSLIEFRATVI